MALVWNHSIRRNETVKKEKICFVIAPIGEPDTDIRRTSDQVFNHIISPAVKPRGYKPVRANHISEPGIITSQVIRYVVESPLVIADLTGRNPNVFYELAIRHAIRKPLLQLIKKGEEIPFDVAGMRTIQFDIHDLDNVEEAKQELVNQIKSVEEGKTKLDTPISVALDLTIEKFMRLSYRFPSLFDTRSRMMEILQEFSKTESLKEIKIIAATGGSIIPLFDEYIESGRPIGNTLIKMLVMDPSCPQTARAAAHWPEEARHNIETSLPVLNDRFKKMGKKVKFEWKTYDFLPSVQGLLFGETYLFIGWWEWVDIGNKKMELTGAARPFSYFEKDDPNAEYFFSLFRSWFDYAWNVEP